MTSAGNRAIYGPGARGLDQLAKALYLGRISRTHLRPDFARAKPDEYTVVRFHDSSADAGTGQAGHDNVCRFRHLPGRVSPARALVEQRLCGFLVKIANGEIKTVAQDAPGQLATDITESDETYLFHKLRTQQSSRRSQEPPSCSIGLRENSHPDYFIL